MLDKAKAIIADELGEDVAKEVTSATLLESIECDSLEFLELMVRLESELGIPQDKYLKCATIGELLA